LKKRQLLEYCISYVCGLNSALGKEQISEFDLFVKKSQTGSIFIFMDSLEILKNRKELIFYKSIEQSPKVKEIEEDISVQFYDRKVLIKQISKEDLEYNLNPNIEFISGDNFKFPLKLKSWDKGDFFYPLGGSAKQKVSDFFVNNKIANNLKNKIPLLMNNEEIVWVTGYRISDKYKITKETKKYYRIEVTR